MTAYNAYTEKQPKGRDAFSAELKGLEFFSEVSETIAEAGSNFANEVKINMGTRDIRLYTPLYL